MPNCSRRSLLQMTGVLTAGHAAQAFVKPFVTAPAAPGQPERGTRLYAALSASTRQPAGIGTFVWSGEAWQSQSFLTAPKVGPLLADEGGELLFAAHNAADSGRPAGFVETLLIDPRTGSLSRGQRQSLALASRIPMAMAISSDRRLLAVVAEGGVFSLLPVQAHGTLGEVSAAYKQLALPITAATAVSLSFRIAAGLGSHPVPTAVSVLTLDTSNQCLQYECRPSGLTFAGTSVKEAQVDSSAITAAPGLPDGTRSYVLQPPLRA